MTESARRHELSDATWRLLEQHLPGQSGQWGGVAQDNRRFINAVFWILRTGAPWRDLPASYGDWKNAHRRFCRWRDRGVWERLLEQLIDQPDMEWLMIDASHCKVHPMRLARAAATREWVVQKGAQYQDTSGRGCAWYASPNSCYRSYPGGL